jgi:deoxycytidine triphosphate deaminase
MERVVTSVLSDGTIRRLVEEKRIVIDPWDPELVQPASVDLRLGDSFRVFHNHRTAAIDLREGPPANLTEEVIAEPANGFVIHPGEFVLGVTREHVKLPDDIVARIEGKALALNTEIPTPTGWTTMGEIQVGDMVLGLDGNPVPVTAATPVLAGRECFELVFSDGMHVIADADHQWRVRTRYDRSRRAAPRVLTTRQIKDTLKVGREFNHHVEQTAPIRYAVTRQPIDPYVLGIWLGDGTSTNGTITTADAPVLAELAVAGYPGRRVAGRIHYRIGAEAPQRDATTGRFKGNGSFQTRLRDLGLLGSKHIPDAYMRASVEQRRALLQGLMDSDGFVDDLGRCELTTTDARLADQYFELIAGLGHRPHLNLKVARLDGRPCGPAFLVKFTPSEPVFRLPRKLARQKLTGRFKRGRSIVAVLQTDSRPVRCIEVGSPDGVFLVTKSFIPTHNSSLGRLGLIVHATAGFVDPGFKGTLTLEITNLTRVPIKLYPGLLIAQLSFMALDAPAERPYGSSELGSHYQGQLAATESRYMR